MINTYSHQQFCLGPGDRPRLALRAHPDLEGMVILTIHASVEAQFALSGTRRQVLAIVHDIAALFDEPLGAGREGERAARNADGELPAPPAYEPDLDTAEDTYER